MRTLLALIALMAAHAAVAQDPHQGETPREKDARMQWWREARFGMFIHWGLYAEAAGTWKGRRTDFIGEWIMQNLKIPVDDYSTLVPGFNPVRFDADRWVGLAKAAGMRYVVMTAKHHDGFAMFHSADPFGIKATPYPRDPIADMAAACKKAGLKFGVYYSQAQDWHHPGGHAFGGKWDPKQEGDLHAYVRNVAAPQVRELMRFKPAVLWWDTPTTMSKEDVDLLTAPLPKGIIMNNRLGNGVPGDTETPEQTIPATGFPGRDWETCMTINDTWGYKSFDTNFKSTQSLVRNLVDIASKGGNYLLNVGPDATGVIPAPEVERLLQMGDWLQKNGRSVYGTSASPYRRLPFDGRVTVKGSSLFVNVFTWPSGPVTLPGLKTPVKEARFVATGERLPFTQKGSVVTIDRLFNTPPDGLPTAIELRLAGKPVVDQPETALAFRGSRALDASEAELTGSLLVEHTPANVGYWGSQDGTVSWRIDVKEAFRGPASILYAADKGSGGSAFTLQLDGKETGVGGEVVETGSWNEYRTLTLSPNLAIPAGIHVLRLVPKSKPGLAVMNLRSLTLGKP